MDYSSLILKNLMTDRFYLILLVVLISSMKYASYRSMWASAIINLVGTVLHECAHFFVGILLNAKPTSFSLFPQKKGDCYVTGNVGFRNMRFYNAMPTSLAPLLLLVVAYYVDKNFFGAFSLSLGNFLFYVFLMTILIENAIPSRTDIRVAFSNILGVVFYGVIGLAIVFWLQYY